MNILKSKRIDDLYIFEDQIFTDDRGSYRQFFDLSEWVKSFDGDALNKFNPHQISASVSKKGVMRGFHGDGTTSKLVSCPIGELQLIVVDVEKKSSTYRKTESFILKESINSAVLIPKTCAVGHLILSDKGMFHYLQSTTYGFHPQFTLTYKDPLIKDLWAFQPLIVSERDSKGSFISELI